MIGYGVHHYGVLHIYIMPSYCTEAEVKLNHDAIPDNVKTDNAIAMHILDVSGLIDSTLRGKIQLPFISTPQIINGIAKDLVTFRTLRGLFGAQSENFQTWILQYKDPAMETLEAIRDCKINLDSDEATAYTKIRSNTSGREAIFTLQPAEDQDYHPTDSDDRYGEG